MPAPWTACSATPRATIPLYDDGLLRGDGAFEYLRCYAGRPFTLVEHLDRMARTCATLRLQYPRELLEEEIAALLAWAGPVFTDLRIVLTRGGRRIVFLEPYLDWPPARLAFVSDAPRLVLAGAKSLSYAGNMVAKRVAEERGFGRRCSPRRTAASWRCSRRRSSGPPRRATFARRLSATASSIPSPAASS